jgi:hypothetical protein
MAVLSFVAVLIIEYQEFQRVELSRTRLRLLLLGGAGEQDETP